MEYAFFVLYILLCLWVFPKISFLKNAKLTNTEIRVLLGIKLFSGIFCAWYFSKTFPIGDHSSINEIGKIQYGYLISNPKLFFTSLTIDIEKYGWGGVFDSSYSFWAYLRFNLLFKFVAILNIISKGSFYFNSVIFSSIVFFGHISFFRIFRQMYPGYKYPLLAICFFIPSIWLYTSCVHKDGFVFLGIAFSCFVFYSYLHSRDSIKIKQVVVFIMSLMIIFVLRNYIIVAMLPAMLIAIACKAFPLSKRLVVPVIYSLFGLIFFLSGFLYGSLNLPAAVVKRKQDFALLGEANTNMPMNNLTPDFSGFTTNLPQAINHSLLRPYLWEAFGSSVSMAALELFFYQVLIIFFLFYGRKKNWLAYNFNIFGLAFFINMMLIIGYTIPNIGAIVRYRGVFWLFILCPILCNLKYYPLFMRESRKSS